jgi:hypothetical protein
MQLTYRGAIPRLALEASDAPKPSGRDRYFEWPSQGLEPEGKL